MPPDDTAVSIILPEPSAPGSDKVSVHAPAGGTPADVGHWFDLETIVDLPAPVASFGDAARWVSPQVFAHCKVLEICEVPKAARTDH